MDRLETVMRFILFPPIYTFTFQYGQIRNEEEATIKSIYYNLHSSMDRLETMKEV